MDKTFNDLVDIVHRTKKINGQDEKKTSVARIARSVSNTEVVEHDLKDAEKTSKKLKMVIQNMLHFGINLKI